MSRSLRTKWYGRSSRSVIVYRGQEGTRLVSYRTPAGAPCPPGRTDRLLRRQRAKSLIVMVGLGPGAIPAGTFTPPDETSVRNPTWGTRSELFEVLDLARSGAIKVEAERFSLEDGPKANERTFAAR